MSEIRATPVLGKLTLHFLSKPHRKWTSKDLVEVREFIEVGVREHELANHYNVSLRTMKRAIRLAKLDAWNMK